MNDTRKRILRVLKTLSQATVATLADEVELSPIAVRHHLNALQAEGLIAAHEVRHGVGRPFLMYRLTEAGQELFPQKYVRLTERLLEELKATLPSATIEQIFAGMAAGLAAGVREQVAGLPPEQRLARLVEVLGEEGFIAHWEKTAEGYRLTGVSCPYIHVGQTHPEVCQFDIHLMTGVLDTPVQRCSCMIEGDAQCTFNIPSDEAA